jgi:putative ATP-dependent endonuclease of OLD family
VYLSRLRARGFRASAERELDVELPGRFAVLAGLNSAGKTTFADAAYLAHPSTFPSLGRFSAAALASGDRSIDVEYRLQEAGHAEGPLGKQALDQSSALKPGELAAAWDATLSRSLGMIRVQRNRHDLSERIRLLYLPANRNPIDELARREARILVELLRAQQQRLDGTRNLTGLRTRAWSLLEQLSADPLIAAVEERVTSHLASLTAGVSKQWSYVRGQRVDDAYLARVLELMLAVLEGRPNARPLEVTGLGYVNLLHIAVTLSAIPDPALNSTLGSASTGTGAQAASTMNPSGVVDVQPETPEQVTAALRQAREEAELQEDSLFGSDPFHAVVLIEEPEAHLHPQLQHALVRHLRRTVMQRPELQVILSTHAPDVLTSARPEDLVVLRTLRNGLKVSRVVAKLPIDDRDAVLRKARLHLDATRSSSLFAERLLLVEGVTDSIVVRELAWAWAGDDADKQAFVDALTIVAMGTRVGPWPVRLLATKGFEIASRLAILSDSDKDFADTPTPPSWIGNHDSGVVRVFHSHPTLEPAVTTGNEPHITAALSAVGLTPPAAITPQSIHATFAGRKAAKAAKVAKGGQPAVPAVPAVPAGPGNSKKAEFALALGEQLLLARDTGATVTVPVHVAELLNFLYPPSTAPTATAAPEPAGGGVPGDTADPADMPASAEGGAPVAPPELPS